MTLLILGATGMLGHKVVQRAVRTSHDVVATVRRPVPGLAAWLGLPGDRMISGVDVTDTPDELLGRLRPDAVINCTGVVKTALGETDVIPAITVNALAPRLWAQACAAEDVRFVHVSTDCVFSGSRGRYTEDDVPDAHDLYGRSKVLGEVSGPGALTVRTSMIGRELSGRRGLLEWLLSRRGQAVDGFARAVFSGVSTAVLADVLIGLAVERRDLDGLYHVAAEPISKLDLLRRLSTAFDVGIDVIARDEPVIDRSLDGGRFRAATGIETPDWDSMIRDLAEDPTPYDDWRNRAA